MLRYRPTTFEPARPKGSSFSVSTALQFCVCAAGSPYQQLAEQIARKKRDLVLLHKQLQEQERQLAAMEAAAAAAEQSAPQEKPQSSTGPLSASFLSGLSHLSWCAFAEGAGAKEASAC